MFPLGQDSADGEEDRSDGDYHQAGKPVMRLGVEVADDDGTQRGDQVAHGLDHPGEVPGVRRILGLKPEQGHCQDKGGRGSHSQEKGHHAVVGK